MQTRHTHTCTYTHGLCRSVHATSPPSPGGPGPTHPGGALSWLKGVKSQRDARARLSAPFLPINSLISRLCCWARTLLPRGIVDESVAGFGRSDFFRRLAALVRLDVAEMTHPAWKRAAATPTGKLKSWQRHETVHRPGRRRPLQADGGVRTERGSQIWAVAHHL